MKEVVIPDGYYMGGHGDPVPVIDRAKPIVLQLHDDGTVTWRRDGEEQRPG